MATGRLGLRVPDREVGGPGALVVDTPMKNANRAMPISAGMRTELNRTTRPFGLIGSTSAAEGSWDDSGRCRARCSAGKPAPETSMSPSMMMRGTAGRNESAQLMRAHVPNSRHTARRACLTL